jgi:hypothetical protein
LRAGLKPRAPRYRAGRWLLYLLGRLLQVTGLVIVLVAATAFFGSQDTTAMLRMMLVGVALFVPGWLLARREPGA